MMRLFFKRLVTVFFAVGIAALGVEFASPVIYQWLKGKTFDQELLLQHLHRVTAGSERWEQDVLKPAKPTKIKERFRLHPFVGYVHKDWQPERFVHNPVPPIADGADNTIRVGIFGASVAGQMGRIKKILAHGLREACYPDKRVVVVFFSQGGFKQPQQLMLLTYLLSLGLPLDVLINVDGLNEVGYMAKKQALEGEYPHHPQVWPTLLRNNLSLPEIRAIAQMAELREQQRTWARLVVETPIVNLSDFTLVLWDIVQQRLEQRFLILYEELSTAISNRARELSSGKRITVVYANDEEMLADFADVWKKSSLLMHQLTQAEGIGYYHFLQPNQHVAGSKDFTEEEMEVAKVGAGTPLEGLVRLGYPLLSKAGKELTAAGVAFEDLTGMFKHEPRSIYIDQCCHMNRMGSELLAREIARRIGEICAGR